MFGVEDVVGYWALDLRYREKDAILKNLVEMEEGRNCASV
jgi:hypothetical protein